LNIENALAIRQWATILTMIGYKPMAGYQETDPTLITVQTARMEGAPFPGFPGQWRLRGYTRRGATVVVLKVTDLSRYGAAWDLTFKDSGANIALAPCAGNFIRDLGAVTEVGLAAASLKSIIEQAMMEGSSD
jgi:hypothetical protein